MGIQGRGRCIFGLRADKAGHHRGDLYLRCYMILQSLSVLNGIQFGSAELGSKAKKD